MQFSTIPAALRSESGKGPAGRLRKSGHVPAVAYGRGNAPISLAVAPSDLLKVLSSVMGRNSVFEISVEGGEKFPVLLCDYQYHPVTRELLHADFLRISLQEPVEVDVPLEAEGKCAGVVAGGTLHVVYRKLPVRCLPGDIPERLVADITELELDAHLSVGDLQLPKGVTVRLPSTQTILSVVTEKTKTDEAEQAAEAEAGAPAAAAAGAAPAPAADKAAAPAKSK